MVWPFTRPTAPEPRPGDRVQALYSFDDSPLLHNTNLAIAFAYDAILDPERLRTSLEALIKRNGWEKLGARLRYNPVRGGHEWHIPTDFSSDRPVVNFFAHDYACSMKDFPATAKIPRPDPAGVRPIVCGNLNDLADLSWGVGNRPGGIGDYYADLSADRPVLGLLVHTFTDGTLVSLNWPHALFDIVGLRAIFQNWMAVLNGNIDSVPTPFAVHEDPLADISSGKREATELHVLKDNRVGIYGLVKWGIGYAWNMIMKENESRIVCVPEAFWKPRLEKAVQDLREQTKAEGGDPSNVFLSENDFFVAWITRAAVAAMMVNPNKTILPFMAANLRNAFAGDLLPSPGKDGPYIGNAFLFCSILLKARDLTVRPLSWIAGEVRRCVAAQGTKEQHLAYCEMRRSDRLGLPIVFMGDGDMLQFAFSSWTKADMYNLDLSGARVTGDVAEGDGKPCKPSYVQGVFGPAAPTDGFMCQGKDGHGNFWFSATRVKGRWDLFQNYVDREVDEGIMS